MKLLNRASVLATFALFSVPAIVTVEAADTARPCSKTQKARIWAPSHLSRLPPACCFGFRS